MEKELITHQMDYLVMEVAIEIARKDFQLNPKYIGKIYRELLKEFKLDTIITN